MSLLKKVQQLTLGLIAMSLMLISCDSNDPTPPEAQANSYFTYLGNTYELAAGCITPDSGDNFIVLYSSGVQLNNDLDGFIGTGNGISFSIYGGNVVGNFTFHSDTSTSPGPGEYRDAEIAINMDASNSSANGIEITSGTTMTVTNGTNGGYIIDVSGSTIANNPYTLHYEGTLTVANIH